MQRKKPSSERRLTPMESFRPSCSWGVQEFLLVQHAQDSREKNRRKAFSADLPGLQIPGSHPTLNTKGPAGREGRGGKSCTPPTWEYHLPVYDSFDPKLFAGTMLWPSGLCGYCGNTIASPKPGQIYCHKPRIAGERSCFDLHRNEYSRERMRGRKRVRGKRRAQVTR